jgi:hypothetical protein
MKQLTSASLPKVAFKESANAGSASMRSDRETGYSAFTAAKNFPMRAKVGDNCWMAGSSRKMNVLSSVLKPDEFANPVNQFRKSVP